jgi:D-arginine dehydrogenase
MNNTATPVEHQVDYILIGGGIAAASIAYWLAPHGRVVILERESQPGYHSTGRSAALFMASYGPPQVRALTNASREFLDNPPPGFCEHPLLTKRGVLLVAEKGREDQLQMTWNRISAEDPQARLLDATQACQIMPALRLERVAGAVLEPGAADMDVHALHQGFLRGARRAGAQLVCGAEVTGLRRHDNLWSVEVAGQTYTAPVVVNAAGAWVDQVAALAGVMPIGSDALRRSAFVFALPPGVNAADWPVTIGIDAGWLVKPDAGMMMGSPINADSVVPQDVQPEELDIALAVDRIEHMTELLVRRPARSWAGLRCFVPDGSLVGGFDPEAAGFFWVAGQGGYGIQTAVAMGETCAALVRGLPVPPAIAAWGVDARALGAARLRSNHLQSTSESNTERAV